jgi:hypothetical protein
MGLLSVRGVIDGIAGVCERRLQLSGKIGIVFDDKDAHG